jgi:hypothetical protein
MQLLCCAKKKVANQCNSIPIFWNQVSIMAAANTNFSASAAQ